MNNKKIYTFLILTMIWSWTFWYMGLNYLVDGMTQESIGKFITFFFIGVYGPSVSGMITTLFFDGLSGLLGLLKKLVVWKVPLSNYMYIILLPIIFVIIGIGLYAVFAGPVGSFEASGLLAIPAVLWAGLYAGPLGEELGWRGFLLPEFLKRFSGLKSAVIIGIIWFAWHIPLFWAPFGTLVSGAPVSIIPVMSYFIMLICLSVIITWLVITSKGSVLVAILFHLSINAGIALLFYPELNTDFKTVHFLSGIPMLIFTIYLITKRKLNIKQSPVPDKLY